MDTSALLVSVETDPGAIAVWSHARITGASAVWATQADIDSTGHIDDLDALEVWGPDGPGGDDSNRLSLFGDPGGIAIWDCVLSPVTACTPTPGATTTAIALALAASGLDPLYDLLPNLQALLDLDALMYDENAFTDDADDRALFSLRPVVITDPAGGGPLTILDGGEVFLWHSVGAVGPGSISYLFQGGHVWDRANCVACEYAHENVDALEAVSTQRVPPVPEPGPLVLIGAGLLGLRMRSRKR